MTTARQRITLDEPIEILVRPVPDDDEDGAGTFRFDPGQKRDPDGRWGDGIPGMPRFNRKSDKLKLAGRITLGPDEHLAASDRVKVEDESEAEMFMAAIDGPDGPQLRIGIPEPDYGDQEYDDDGNVIEKLTWSGNDPGDTVRLDTVGQERLRSELDAHTETARARQAEAARNFAEIDRLEARYYQLRDEARDRRDPETLVIAPEDRAKIDAVQAELELLYDWQEAFEPDASIAEGLIPGVAGFGDLAYHVEGADDGKFGWTVRFAVRPPDALPDWSMYGATRTEGGTAVMDGVDQARFQRQVASMLPSATVTAADDGEFAFSPSQARDRQGKWTKGAGIGIGLLSDLDDWSAQAHDPGDVTSADLLRVGGRIGEIMTRDGTSMADPLALLRATREAVADDGGKITPRQYVRAMDRDYFTNAERDIADALTREAPDLTPDQKRAVELPRVPVAPSVTPVREPEGPPEWSPNFETSYADRSRRLQEGIDSGPADGEQLAGGDIASTYGFTWNDGSRAVLKEAKRTIRHDITPKDQTDAEELAGLVGEALGVPAPAAQRVSDTEIYLEYMPGDTGMKRFGGNIPYRLTNSEQGLNMGLFDQVIGNPDRHNGNWTIDRDDRIYAIDHGLAFTDPGTVTTYGPFAFELLYGGHEISRSRLREVRAQLEGLRGHFKRLKRREWYENMIERLNDVENRVGGGAP